METILVIDDELFMRRLCDDMLSLRGFKVLTAESAKEGLAKLEQGGMDVILLDIMMPEMTGLELLPLIKKADPDAYAIIITAYASLDNALEASPHRVELVVERLDGRLLLTVNDAGPGFPPDANCEP